MSNEKNSSAQTPVTGPGSGTGGREDTQSEFDQYDLLAENSADRRSSSSVPDTDLRATLGAFSTRIQKKKQAQVQAETEAEQLARRRHATMLEALMNIRRSLVDVARIGLGDRFHFSLDTDDWQGWPRLTIKLVDSIDPQAEYPYFQVIGHDRNNSGTIEIICGDSQKPMRLTLAEAPNVKKVPLFLKKCARTYLDIVGDIVLEEEREAEHDDGVIVASNVGGFETAKKSEDGPEITGDLFEENLFEKDFLERLPDSTDVESLPLDSSQEK